ncbi:PQQ-binding-like beta-propeller repeat protein [Microbacterium sp. TWP3-1-2b2]|uniref:outer membrane protein assembly factor BamB family protein n=1 Tax=Microbacterium sp. TWP3-1-2b2 TaxID=2804651 RepID=UPI003CEB3813
MPRQLTTRLGVAGVAAAVMLSIAISPVYAVDEPVDDLTATEPTQEDMPTVGGNLGNQHYSALDQITKSNLDQLAPAWRTHVSAAAPASDHTGQQTTPIVVDGMIYLDTPSGGVAAFDGATGEAAWKWENHEYGMSSTRRGVSAGDGRVYTLAGDNRVVALDQKTGEEVWAVQPTGPDGENVGRVAKVATVYSDGLVYVHAADGDRGAVVALDADDGSYVWHFFGGPNRGEEFTDVNGNTFDASETWGPVHEDGTDCAIEGGATSWVHGAVDPDLGMYYMTFGNPRSCNTSQDGSGRPGDNVFSDTLVAVDAATGEYKWHYQSIHHDIWDMDNVHAPNLADIEIGGEERQVIFYGSKSGHMFILDRTNGQPVLPANEKPVITDDRQANSDTQPFPSERLLPECVVWEKLGTDNVPGDPWRGVPNYNGYQPDENGELVFNPDSYVAADQEHLTYPEGHVGHREGCMYDPQWDLPILSTTSQNGGGDWSNNAYSHSTNLVYFPYGTNNVAHWNGAAANGQRAIGQYQTGGIVAYDASTGKVEWLQHLGTDMSHGQGPLATASDLVFVGQIDGRLLAMDAKTGEVEWDFQTGNGIGSAPVTYEIDGEQYVAVFAAGTTNPYGASVTKGDSLWAFKLGGDYVTESGSQEGPLTAPLSIRRPVNGGAVEGSTVGNTVLLARADRTSDTAAAADSTNQAAMQPTHLRVPVGTSVTFLNPGAETFGAHPNELEHCATQFFEGEFNARLQPGESYAHTFEKAGEYFFNDCTDPRPTGKIEVYAESEDIPGALSVPSGKLDLRVEDGLFTNADGTITAHLDLPKGYAQEGDVLLETSLGLQPITASKVTGNRSHIVVKFDKADLDNNVPEGATDLTVITYAMHDGVQKEVRSTVSVTVTK